MKRLLEYSEWIGLDEGQFTNTIKKISENFFNFIKTKVKPSSVKNSVLSSKLKSGKNSIIFYKTTEKETNKKITDIQKELNKMDIYAFEEKQMREILLFVTKLLSTEFSKQGLDNLVNIHTETLDSDGKRTNNGVVTFALFYDYMDPNLSTSNGFIIYVSFVRPNKLRIDEFEDLYVYGWYIRHIFNKEKNETMITDADLFEKWYLIKVDKMEKRWGPRVAKVLKNEIKKISNQQ